MPALTGARVDPVDRLTPRQRDLLVLLGEGLTIRALARRLVVTESSVKSRITELRRALGLATVIDLRTLAHQRHERSLATVLRRLRPYFVQPDGQPCPGMDEPVRLIDGALGRCAEPGY